MGWDVMAPGAYICGCVQSENWPCVQTRPETTCGREERTIISAEQEHQCRYPLCASYRSCHEHRIGCFVITNNYILCYVGTRSIASGGSSP